MTQASRIPDLTIETFSRNFFKESAEYGFTQLDYVKFVNHLLDLSMRRGDDVTGGSTPGAAAATHPSVDEVAPTLPLSGPNVMIRAFVEASDLPVLEGWLADAAGRHFLLSRTTSRLLDVNDIVRDPANVLGFVTLPGGAPVGCMAFLDHDCEQHKAELRKLIGDPTHRGKGLAKEATALWIRYGLAQLGLRKIYLSTLETDIRNVRLNEELGFRVEGVLRNELLIDGAYHDILRMGLWRG